MSTPRVSRASLPEGTVTFVFTDIEGSTALWDRDPAAMQQQLAEHLAHLADTIRAHHGHVVKTLGDGVMAVFRTASDAIDACVGIQRDLRKRAPASMSAARSVPLRVRMGMHTGEAELRDGDYFGNALNVAARIMGVAQGEQILLSEVTAAIVARRLSPGMSLRPLGTHHLKGIAEPLALLQLDAEGLRQEFDAIASDLASDALPRPATTFIGREGEILECLALLARTRLLTLTGLGGSGKTRLAIEIAARSERTHPDEVHFVDLSPVATAERVPTTVAAAMGVRDTASGSVIDALCVHARSRSLLLLLDNCEHVVASCAALVEAMISRTDSLRVVATSRESLGVAGEQVYAVPPLSVARDAASPDDPSDAARLFIERARLVNPHFAHGVVVLRSVEAIVRRLEGIPLAIELAAPRVRLLSLEDLDAKLAKRFQLLKATTRVEKRHLTLLGVIEWSYLQLPANESAALRRLAVFAGGWTLEAAASVIGCDEYEAIDVTQRLVDKSLVVIDTTHEAHLRYRMLETVREFAMERLHEAGEAAATSEAHFNFFHRIAAFIRAPRDRDFDANERRLSDEFDNVMAAYDWCRSRAELAEQRVMLALGLARVLANRAQQHAARDLLADVVASSAAALCNVTQGEVLITLGDYELDLGFTQDAERHLSEGLAIARQSGDDVLLARALLKFGAALFASNVVDARAYTEEALMKARALGLHFEIGAALVHLGELFRLERRFEDAARCYGESLTLFETVGLDPTTILFNLAIAATEIGDAQRAQECLRNASSEASRRNSQYQKCWLPHHTTALASALADHDFAARMWGAAAAARELSHLVLQFADVGYFETHVARSREALGDASFAAHFHAGRALSIEQAVQEIDDWLTRVAPVTSTRATPDERR